MITFHNQDSRTAEMLRSLPKGTTVYTIVRHVSQSGMSRAISAHIVLDNKIEWLNLGELLRLKMHKTHHGYVMQGAGMNMAYSVVHNIGRTVHDDGYYFTHQAL